MTGPITDAMKSELPSLRADLRMIADMVEPRSRVLDVGCGNGELLQYLTLNRQVDGRGIELRPDRVNAAVRQGLSVIQGDADSDLALYPDASFDVVILTRTLQAVEDPRGVLEALCRIGRRAIVSIPNFGYWRIRTSLLFGGRMPRAGLLDRHWYDSDNIHLCTIRDLRDLVEDLGLSVETAAVLDGDGEPMRTMARGPLGNLLGQQIVMVLSRRDGSP